MRVTTAPCRLWCPARLSWLLDVTVWTRRGTPPHMGGVKVRYTYRLRPGADAQAYLLREFGMCRWVWNHLVAQSRLAYRLNAVSVPSGNGEVTFGPAQQDKFLTGLRASTVDADSGERWLAAGSSVAQQQMVRDFAAARVKALKDRKDQSVPASRKAGLPRFKKRGVARPTLNYTRRGFSLPEVDGVVRLRLPGKVDIPVVWSRPLPSPPTSVRVSQDTLGHWYASFVVDVEHQAGPTVLHPDIALGIDWGVTETATTARVNLMTGEVDETPAYDLPHAQHGKAAADTLAKAQRKMARRAKRDTRGRLVTDQSRGYRKARWQAARAHRKVADQRKDDARKWARRVAADHEHIAVEDFKPKFLAKTTMARKAADAAIAATKQELIWQARKAGRDLRLVHPRNTTTDCANCGTRTKHRLPLGQRTYTCEICGVSRPRDKNSATVMVARAGFEPHGLASHEVVPADAEDRRPDPAAVLGKAV